MYIKFGKRILDCMLSAFLLIILLPLFIIISIVIWFDIGRPIFFQQQRVGLIKKEFTIYKFRTIRGQIHQNLTLSTDEINSRTSILCNKLRLHCIDEIPQLWNVLLGHMSIVGPRPLLFFDFTRNKTPNEIVTKLYSVKPGITGAGQITMRKEDYQDNWTPEHDLSYVDNISLLNDIKIIINTIPVVIRGH